MTTELERYKQAVKEVSCALTVGSDGGLTERGCKLALKAVNAILHPEPQYEEVKEKRYIVIDAQGTERWYGAGSSPGIAEGEHIVCLVGTYRRAIPQPVDKSVTVECGWHETKGPGSCSIIYPYDPTAALNLKQFLDKRGTLTFTWTDPQ